MFNKWKKGYSNGFYRRWNNIPSKYFSWIIKVNFLRTVHPDLRYTSDGEFIENYLSFWENYKVYLRWHRKIFYYLDRYFLKNDNKSLYKEGFKILK